VKRICNIYKCIVDDFKYLKAIYFGDKKILIGTVVVFLLSVVIGKLL
jgi:hypothetical protein